MARTTGRPVLYIGFGFVAGAVALGAAAYAVVVWFTEYRYVRRRAS